MKILIVDDDSEICEFVATALQRDGHDCDIENNGGNAIKRVGEDQYDLVLLDVIMPEVDGVEVMNSINENSDNGRPPVIAMTGGGRQLPGWFAGQMMEMLGGKMVLNKPFSLQELRSAVNSVG